MRLTSLAKKICTTFLNSPAPSAIILLTILIFVSQTLPEPRIFLPMPSFRPLPVSIPSSVCSSPTPFLALVLVLSHPANFERRTMVRRTYPAQEIALLGYRRVFVFGTWQKGDTYRNLTVTDSAIQAESDQHDDIMQLNHTELYDDLIVKAYGAFTWVTQNCGHARFIVKNDDDMFFDYYLMERALKEVSDTGMNSSIFGNLIKDTWNLTPYMAGGTYVMSPKTLEMLIDAATRIIPPIQPFMHYSEDVYFTGLVADRVGVERKDLALIRSWQGTPMCCSTDDGDFFQCEFSVFMQKPLQLPFELLIKFKERGKMCYYFSCEQYSPSLMTRRDVKCFQ